ncbi:MAG: hypothetical protein AAGD38_11785 [Acidobacteriota bacterium]
MIRRCLFFFILTLFTVSPLLAQPASLTAEPVPGCALAEREAETARLLGGSSVEPVPAEWSLLHDLSVLPRGPIEIRYHVDGELYLVETADLIDARPPQRDHPRVEMDIPEVLELLTLRPDIVRRFHRMHEEGTRIEVELVTDRSILERLSFGQVMEQSAALRQQGALPVTLLTEVAGSGATLPPVPRLATRNGCGFCTSTSDCDDVGPYDDGKGDCTTCGEYGVCDPGGCACSSVINTYWTSWFVTGFTYVGPYRCIDYSHPVPDSRALRAQVTYRRNQVRVTRTCPNCPSCSGCYNTESIINYQTQTLYCYVDQNTSCSPGDSTIGTWELCP